MLLAVPAMLAGLLTMHVLNTGAMSAAAAHSSHEVHTASMAVQSHLGSTSMPTGEAAPDHGCGGPCTPGHEMLGSMCVLALLITLILFTRQPGLDHGHPHLLAATARAVDAATLAPSRPPSLYELSISRT